MEFSPRGEEVWVSVRDEDRVMVYDTNKLIEKARFTAHKPSGIFFSSRAHKLGL
jgi:protein NirF